MTDTPLDTAFIAMDSEPDNDPARLTFYERFSESELFLLLEREPEGDQVEPRIFNTEDGDLVLVFDREHRLTEFAEGAAPYAAVSGRSLTAMLNAQSIGIGLNLGVAPSSIIIPENAVSWLYDTLDDEPLEVTESPEEILPPGTLPERLVAGIDIKLAQAAGLADFVYLAAVKYQGGRNGHLLAFIGATPGAEPALTRSAKEALIFSGLDAGEVDVAFFKATDQITAKLAKLGLRFDLPKAPEASMPSAPGMDPDTPPRLR